MIRTIPITLNQWSPNVSLTKDDLTKVPVWVRLYEVPLVGYTEVGLSVIASKIGRPMMLDAYTSTMCLESWGRPNFARAMIEVSSKQVLKESLKVATPNINGSGNTIDEVRIEYDWKPPRCSCCKVFGHNDSQCPKVVVVETAQEVQPDTYGFVRVNHKKNVGLSKNNNLSGGFNMGKGKPKLVYRPKQNVNANTGHNDAKQNVNANTGHNDAKKNLKSDDVHLGNKFGPLVDQPDDNAELKLVDEESDVEPDKGEMGQFIAGKNMFEGASTPGVDGLQ
ncbi:uncharacterized protein [Rutidosis leptorrhynchoides]|uniref:uncharacterized protein isoform X1 n=1 Tax=Rutidosis leptorrhynchoides TaxID=125765 RepID=UPI003A9A28D7